MGLVDNFRLDGKAAVVLCARRVDRLDESARRVERARRRAIAVRTDVTSPEGCRAPEQFRSVIDSTSTPATGWHSQSPV